MTRRFRSAGFGLLAFVAVVYAVHVVTDRMQPLWEVRIEAPEGLPYEARVRTDIRSPLGWWNSRYATMRLTGPQTLTYRAFDVSASLSGASGVDYDRADLEGLRCTVLRDGEVVSEWQVNAN